MTDQCVQSTSWSVPLLRVRPVPILPANDHRAEFRTFAGHIARMAEQELAAATRQGGKERKR